MIEDLVVLVADKNMEFFVRGLLSRHQSLRIREVSYSLLVHPNSDPGCLREAHLILRPLSSRYAYGLVLLDREGCGKERSSREALELEMEQQLVQSGWEDRAAVVVINPELEAWVWNKSPHVDRILGWEGRQPDLRTWLKDCGFLEVGQNKPFRPKEAMELALKKVYKARSSSRYQQLAQCMTLARCDDPAFNKMISTLKKWFPEQPL